MLKVTGADERYIKQRRRQLSDYRKQYLEFLDNTDRTRISANEWVGTLNIKSSMALFNDNIVTRDFSKLSKNVETMIIYDSKNGNRIHQISTNSKSSVGDFKSYYLFKTSQPNSLAVAHNHPSNSSFSKKDMMTFNNFRSIETILVETENYTYFLDKNNIKRVKTKNLEKTINNIREIYYNKYGKTKEAIHLSNKEIAKRIGWNYGRIKK